MAAGQSPEDFPFRDVGNLPVLPECLERGVDRRPAQSGTLQEPSDDLLVRLLVVHHHAVSVARVGGGSIRAMDTARVVRPVQAAGIVRVGVEQRGGRFLAAQVAQRVGRVPGPLRVLEKGAQRLERIGAAQTAQRLNTGLDAALRGKPRFW